MALTIFLIQFKSGFRFDPTNPMDSTNNSNPISVATDINIEPQIDEMGYSKEINEKIRAIP